MTMDQWKNTFSEFIANFNINFNDEQNIIYKNSSNKLRTLLKSNLLESTSLYDNPEKFFLAHKIIASNTTKTGPGFWVRVTVQYNLFAGTILALGSQSHLSQLQDIQFKGLLGCFNLTEYFAGVNSGLVINTTAEWNNVERNFTINTPNKYFAKNWISQGLVADKTVIIANLIVNQISHGPHAFLIDMRINGNLVPGINIVDMGLKTVGNDLDNACITFTNLTVSKECFLNKYADIINNKYILKDDSITPFMMIGQRLFSGRIAVAQAALEFRRTLFNNTLTYAKQKRCWIPNGYRLLSDVPQIKNIFEENKKNQIICDNYVSKCENKLCLNLKLNKLPSKELIDAIAIAKIKCVEDSISFVHSLQNEIGSYALMQDSGFGNRDFLTCCKFAEGDTRILMQKLVRDFIKGYTINSSNDRLDTICKKIISDGPTLWDNNFKLVYELAQIIIDETIVVSKQNISKL